MKNIIEYYYNLSIDNIKKTNNDYYFVYNNNEYMFYYVNDKIRIQKEILDVCMLNKNFHQIVLNINKEICTTINEEKYILMKINIKSNRIINIDDIIYFISTSPIREKKKIDWGNLWKEKIDYLEYYINKKESINDNIKCYLSYYLGLAENAVEYLRKINITESEFILSHRRINEQYTLIELYNPLNIIIDCKERDISEYLKSLNYKCELNEANMDEIINKTKKIIINYQLVYGRMLFPTYIFDMLDYIENENFSKSEIMNIYSKAHEYEKNLAIFLEKVFSNARILQIEWIKKQINIH